ncbi:MAG: AAA family ATPase [Lachnospiraceae bacterium]|jgi:MoxR-like ATPase|nr:AAA family ATPase [Lachnospiraceae bacterium]
MNIKQAKDYIKNSVSLYLKKDEFGDYRVPVVRQRPIFLLGAPGIGKTAIMEQIAQELGIALVAYSMTHHTRQSALGLPFIEKKNYGGKEYPVSEYTMSEIIASIYDTMEESGIKEGILFLDEINCVSETLAPSMLQFLQYKVFGRHAVPEGWVIVTAGNPPEYNKSVREFDVVTMDRLKVLPVEPDYRIWKEYATERGVHAAVLNFLDLKKECFYVMEMTTQGRSYVTARGWEDLSEILKLYEEEELKVEESLVEQYIRNPKVVKEFTAYYDLFNKYKKDYRVEEILAGAPSVQALARAKEASFDERLSLLGMLLDKVQAEMKDVMEQAAYLSELRAPLKALLTKAQEGKAGNAAAMEESVESASGNGAGATRESSDALAGMIHMLDQMIEGRRKLLYNLQTAGSLSDEDKRKNKRVLRFLEDRRKELFLREFSEEMHSDVSEKGMQATGENGGGSIRDGQIASNWIKQKYNGEVARMKQETQRTGEQLHAMFSFVEQAFQNGNEMLILVTELTVGKSSSAFIATFGSEDYRRHNEELMLSERQNDLKGKIAELGL